MSTYAIGDIQGCFRSLQALLDSCRFNPAQDKLWLVGDLVNRGPQSLNTLRFIRNLGKSAITVLGNHDLYLLMVAYGSVKKRGTDDTLNEILSAPDCEELLTWLRSRPLCHVENGFCLVHAGLLPEWSAKRAVKLSKEVEDALQGNNFAEFLSELWGSEPKQWSNKLTGTARLRMIVNAMTRMRLCSANGQLDFKTKGPLSKAPADLMPWFNLPNRKSSDHTLIVGHWSALGLRIEPNLLAIDTGCLWGGKMTAIRLEDRAIFQVSCDPADRASADF